MCLANVHMTMEAHDSAAFRRVVNQADLVCPDGMPLVWLLRRRGRPGQGRVYGPNLTLHVCAAAEAKGLPVGFYGGSRIALERMVARLRARFPGLRIAYTESPPFRPVTPEADQRIVAALNASGVHILFVGLGCPKQEWWMAEHRSRVRAVMLGVGAAFDFLSELKPQAPVWMQRMGLEWLFRLGVEPRRLWRRYLVGNSRFVVHVALEELRHIANRLELWGLTGGRRSDRP